VRHGELLLTGEIRRPEIGPTLDLMMQHHMQEVF
jgi:hypothetical protein